VAATLVGKDIPEFSVTPDPSHNDEYLRSLKVFSYYSSDWISPETGDPAFDERFLVQRSLEASTKEWLNESRRAAIAAAARKGVFLQGGEIIWRAYSPPKDLAELEQIMTTMTELAKQLR